MDNRKSFLIVAGAILVLIILAAGVVAWLPAPANDVLKVSCVGMTNDIMFGNLAVFAITNQSGDDIYFGCSTFQSKSHGVWFPMSLSFACQTNLPAHTASTFKFIGSTNCDAWRVPVMWWHDRASPVEFIQGELEINMYRNFQRAGRFQMPQFHSVSSRRGHLVFSPEITNQ